MNKQKRTKQEKGITLIALIITIIVLLILAVVAIRAVSGDGIISHAKNAKDEYQKSQTKEELELARYEALLQEETYSYAGLTIDENTEGIIKLDNNVYQYGNYIYASGQVVLIENPTLNSDGNYGELCGMVCGMKTESIMSLFSGHSEVTTAPRIPNTVVVMQESFSGTSIKTTPFIPTSVYGMDVAFVGCTELTTVTNIPTSAQGVSGCFMYCTNLKTVPVLPETITYMDNMFLGCSSLTEIPNIPSKTISLDSTFNGCSSLRTVPTIPKTVTNMTQTFSNCDNLTGTITINTQNLEQYNDCFASEGSPSPITLTGTCPVAIRFEMSRNGHGNITVPDYVRTKLNEYKKYVQVEVVNNGGPTCVIFSGTPTISKTAYCNNDNAITEDYRGIHILNGTYGSPYTVDGDYVIFGDSESYVKYKFVCELYDDQVELNL